jgi:hypothetical protein
VSGPRIDGQAPEDITLFDAATGLEVRRLTDPSPLRAPEQAGFRDVSEMVFVENGTRLVVAWRSGRLASWRVEDGALLWSRLDGDPN